MFEIHCLQPHLGFRAIEGTKREVETCWVNRSYYWSNSTRKHDNCENGKMRALHFICFRHIQRLIKFLWIIMISTTQNYFFGALIRPLSLRGQGSSILLILELSLLKWTWEIFIFSIDFAEHCLLINYPVSVFILNKNSRLKKAKDTPL